MASIEDLLLGKPVGEKLEPEEALEICKGNREEEVLSSEEAADVLGASLLLSDGEVIEEQVEEDRQVVEASIPIVLDEVLKEKTFEETPSDFEGEEGGASLEGQISSARGRVKSGEWSPSEAIDYLKGLDKSGDILFSVAEEFVRYKEEETSQEPLKTIEVASEALELEDLGIEIPKQAVAVEETPDPSPSEFVDDVGFDFPDLYHDEAQKVSYTEVDTVPLPNGRVVLVDGSNMAMRCFFPLKDMCRSDGKMTGLLFGMLKSIRAIQRDCKALPVLVWDGGGTGKKQKVYAGYKGNREPSEVKSSCFDQLRSVKEWLRYLGVPQARSSGEEADDVIAALAMGTFKEALVFIYSNDDDFLQLVDDRHCIVVKPGPKFFDSEKVKDHFGVPPHLVPTFRSLRGDKSDNLPGIPYFRSNKIAELVLEHETLENIYASPSENFQSLSEKAREKIVAFKDQAFVNRELMVLDAGVKPEIQVSDFDPVSLRSLFEEMEFSSLLEDFESWEREFGITKGFMKTS